jgi:hypothetical protein
MKTLEQALGLKNVKNLLPGEIAASSTKTAGKTG